jgi:hypothetical protein
MHITITYKDKELTKDELEQLISLSREHGDVEVQKRGSGSGALDLLNYIEIKLFDELIKGLFGADYLKGLGSTVFKSIIHEVSAIGDYYASIYKIFIKGLEPKSRSIAIVEEFEGHTIYAVLNYSQFSEKLARDLAEAIVKTFSLISSKRMILESPKVLQLYPNFSTQTWDYVFAPTTQAYGKFIDRYYDFKDDEIHIVHTAEEFLDLFNVSDLDEYRFIISAKYHLNR